MFDTVPALDATSWRVSAEERAHTHNRGDSLATVQVTPTRTTAGRVIFLAVVYDGANFHGLRIDPASRRFV